MTCRTSTRRGRTAILRPFAPATDPPMTRTDDPLHLVPRARLRASRCPRSRSRRPSRAPQAASAGRRRAPGRLRRLRRTRCASSSTCPGIAVAIVEGRQASCSNAATARASWASRAQVDEHTLFAIASNTKAFTAASLSMLADEGKLSLDDRVIDHLPWFRMSDPYVTREMRIARPARAPQRPEPGRGRPAVLADDDVHDRRSRAPPEGRAARPASSAASTPTTTSCSASRSWWSKQASGMTLRRLPAHSASSSRWAWTKRASTAIACEPRDNVATGYAQGRFQGPASPRRA